MATESTTAKQEPATERSIGETGGRMNAVVHTRYGPPDVLRLEEVEKPTPGDDEVLIRIRATTVTAVDCIFRSGASWLPRVFYTGVRRPKNAVLGTDLAGDVESVGGDVDSFEVGDRVFGDSDSVAGTYAEYVRLPEDGPLATIPADVTYEEAAAIPYGALTALPFLRDSGKIRSGHRVLVNGASGSVGTAAVQLAKHFGAEVTGVCGPTNVELVKSLGADRVIDYTEEDFTRTGETYDVVFDAVGKSSFSRCKGSLKRGGIYLTTVLTPTILLRMLWTSRVGSKRAIIAFTGLRPSSEKRADLLFLRELVEAGELKPVIDRRYPLERIVEAHEYVETGHKAGNVVVTIGRDVEA